MISEGPEFHHWLEMDSQYTSKRRPIPERTLDGLELIEGKGDFGDFQGLVSVVKALYHTLIRREITVCTVDRDPLQIKADLRRYLQHTLLARATRNKAFAHVMVPRFTFIDPLSGRKIDEADLNYMEFVERILQNMQTRYHYPASLALATIVFALRKQVIDFRNILS